MIEPRTIQLPTSETYGERCLELGFTSHTDVLLSVWQGDPEFDRSTVAWARHYQMSHGSEVLLFAAMLGYHSRLERSDEEMLSGFAGAIAVFSADEPLADYKRIQHYGAESVAHGEPISIFDRPDLDWQNLIMPIPRHPGAHHDDAAALFTTRMGSDVLYLVIANVMDYDGDAIISPAEVATATYLEPADAPPIAQLLAEESRGEYRDDMRLVLRERFPTLTEASN